MRPAGYSKVISWLSDTWTNFDSEIIEKSFNCTGILSRNELNRHLEKMINERRIIDDYIEELSDDEIEVI